MLALGHDGKVLNPIVILHAVDVMHFFVRSQQSPNVGLDHEVAPLRVSADGSVVFQCVDVDVAIPPRDAAAPVGARRCRPWCIDYLQVVPGEVLVEQAASANLQRALAAATGTQGRFGYGWPESEPVAVNESRVRLLARRRKQAPATARTEFRYDLVGHAVAPSKREGVASAGLALARGLGATSILPHKNEAFL